MSIAPENLTDPEREHFVRQIHDLQVRLLRWRLACLALLALLLLPVVLGGLLGVWWVPRLEGEGAAGAGDRNATPQILWLLANGSIKWQDATQDKEAR